MSQDPLELFFGCVRHKLGYNNNPTVPQFQGAYKGLCAGALLKTGVGGNCLWMENMDLLTSSIVESQNSVKSSLCEDVLHYENLAYKIDILTYIAGNTQCILLQKVDCDSCSNYIQREEAKQSCSLLILKILVD